MNVPGCVSPIGIMVGISAVTMSRICMIWITVTATGRVTAFPMVIWPNLLEAVSFKHSGAQT